MTLTVSSWESNLLARAYGPLENLIMNGEFDRFTFWSLNVNSPAEAKRTIDNGIYKVEITANSSRTIQYLPASIPLRRDPLQVSYPPA